MLLWHTNVVGLYAVSALAARGLLRRLCRRIAQGIVGTDCRSQKTGLLRRRARTRQCALSDQLRGRPSSHYYEAYSVSSGSRKGQGSAASVTTRAQDELKCPVRSRRRGERMHDTCRRCSQPWQLKAAETVRLTLTVVMGLRPSEIGRTPAVPQRCAAAVRQELSDAGGRGGATPPPTEADHRPRACQVRVAGSRLCEDRSATPVPLAPSQVDPALSRSL